MIHGKVHAHAQPSRPSNRPRWAHPRYVGVALLGAIVVACSSTVPSQAPEGQAGTVQSPLAISDLFGTGLGAGGAALADGAVDPHYTLTLSGDLAFPGPQVFVVDQGVYPLTGGTWVDDSAASKWISVQAGNSASAAAAAFSYTTTFTLTGVDPTTASITGQWGCDNTCVITLNGAVVPQVTPGYAALGPFSIPAGSPFVAGANTLTFIVTNATGPSLNPTGLRVEIATGAAGCGQDGQCPNGSWCNNVTVTPGECQPLIANGDPVPGNNCSVTVSTTPGTVGSRACKTGACDTSDNRCGYANSDGPCATGTVCRSSVCNPALAGGLGRCEECTAANTTNCAPATPVCDSSTFTCAACNGDNGTSGTATCPPAAPYCPGNGGACTMCGVASGTTTCTAAGAVHAGGVCEPSGACGSACVDDSNCTTLQWCNTGSAPGPTCVAKLINGTPIPTVPNHTPALDHVCTVAVGAAVCASGVCDTGNDACGYATGGPCTPVDPGVCQSGECSTNGTCRPASGCNVDADCAAKQYCETTTHTCLPQVATGLPIPGGGTCTAGKSNRCLAGVCAADDICGDLNGTGPCTTSNAGGTSGVCRSGVCDPKDSKCGLANGDGVCTILNGLTICRSGICAIVGPNSGDCVQCTSSVQCIGTGTPVCNLTTNTCGTGGISDAGTDSGSGSGGGVDSGSGGGVDSGSGGGVDSGSGSGGGVDSGSGGGVDSGSGSGGGVDSGSGGGVDSGSGSGGGVDSGSGGGVDSGSGSGGGVDSGSGGGTDSGSGGGVDSGSGGGVDSGTDSGSGGGVDSGTDSGSGGGVDSGTDSGSGGGVDSGTDSGSGGSTDSGSDAGPVDAGADAATASDGGQDGGATDAGRDGAAEAGTTADSGSGTDSGALADSGSPSDSGGGSADGSAGGDDSGTVATTGDGGTVDENGEIQGGGCTCKTQGAHARSSESGGVWLAVVGVGLLLQRRRRSRKEASRVPAP